MTEQTFEASMKELEEISSKMSSDSLSVDEMMELFKRGMELCTVCQKKLDGYEKQIRTITDGAVEGDA